MIRVVTDSSKHRLPFYLALEEWLARNMPAAEYLYTWRVEPTVIFGRNQNVALEVDLEYCRNRGIQVYRRRSGGGCVYADMDNLMISYITPSTDVSTTFAGYTSKLANLLCALGVPAEATGRNDVTIYGKKVSGNAFYHLPGRSIVHGTLLFTTDMENMMHAITPSRSKLESNKVTSVQSRITTLSEYLDMSIEDFVTYLYDNLTDSEYVLTDDDIAEVEILEQRYYDLSWIFGKRGILSRQKDSKRVIRRISGVGDFDLLINTQGGRISDIDLIGDFFILSDLDSSLFDRLKGCELSEESIGAALVDVDLGKVISGLSTSEFVKLLMS